MTIIVGSARIDERSKLSGGSAGDQTGKEVSTQNFYMHSKGWYALRPKSVDVANKLATAMKQACNNNKIGYDQSNRSGVVTNVKKYGTLAKISVKTEADCSSLVRACIYQATGKDVGDFNTSSEVSVLEKSGLFKSKKSISSSSEVYNGDVLVTKTKGHTVIVVSGRARVSTSSTSYYSKYTGSSGKIDEVFKAIGVPEKYRGSYKKRKPVAVKNSIASYTGSASQNLSLIELAKQGKLKKA